MRIGILLDEISPGSAPKLLGWPIRKLKESGIDAQALVIIDKGNFEKFKVHYDSHLLGVRIRYLFPYFPKLIRKLNFKFPGMSFFSLHHIVSFLFAHRAIEKNEFDIIIAHCQYSAFAAHDIKKYFKVPFLLLVWDPATYTAKKIYRKAFNWKYPFIYLGAKLLDKFAFSGCEAVITSGKFHHGSFKRLTGKPLEVLYPGCFPATDFPEFSRRKSMILTYDRWDIGNVPNIFLEMLQRIKYQDVKLVIGGFWHPESLREDFKNEYERRGLNKRVNLLGPLDEEMIRNLCSQAMVHVHPVHEAFGMQSLEAAACGCPIIIPLGSGVTDLFEHGVHGYFPEKSNIDEFVKYIDLIFEDRKTTEKMSRNAWETAKNYTWEGYAKKLTKICRRYVHGTN